MLTSPSENRGREAWSHSACLARASAKSKCARLRCRSSISGRSDRNSKVRFRKTSVTSASCTSVSCCLRLLRGKSSTGSTNCELLELLSSRTTLSGSKLALCSLKTRTQVRPRLVVTITEPSFAPEDCIRRTICSTVTLVSDSALLRSALTFARFLLAASETVLESPSIQRTRSSSKRSNAAGTGLKISSSGSTSSPKASRVFFMSLVVTIVDFTSMSISTLRMHPAFAVSRAGRRFFTEERRTSWLVWLSKKRAASV
mmetsp:Transcript_8212/g.30297  ORF Transcript_8212/g.30297 Transcript_8212/m.30297 type:complete len:258 (+) Transcript_8212:1724-2497(+)